MNANSILFAGEIFDGRDPDHPRIQTRDSALHLVRVRELPARHHLELLDLFHIGREADLIQRCCETSSPPDSSPPGSFTWSPVTPEWVDALTDASHQALADACEKLNFQRAIATAQRQIARGTALRPVMLTMMKPWMQEIRGELDSWMSSLTTQFSAALGGKAPSTKP